MATATRTLNLSSALGRLLGTDLNQPVVATVVDAPSVDSIAPFSGSFGAPSWKVVLDVGVISLMRCESSESSMLISFPPPVRMTFLLPF